MSEPNSVASQFNKPINGSYLLAHSIGLLPKNAPEYLSDHFFEPWKAGGDDIWPNWLSAITEFNKALADLFNSDADLFCPQSNISSGLTKVIQALPKKKGRNVILATESDFPSTGFVLQQAERLGFEVRRLPPKADLQSVDVWDEALSRDVHSVFVTQVLYNTNKLLPVRGICELANARDIVTIVDIAQSAGIVPIDAQKLDADVLIGSCIKWLCGGPGAGFLWLRRELISQLKPLDVGWFSHQDPFEFDISDFDYHQGAARFWGGTPSVSAYLTATNSVRLITRVGVKAVCDHNRLLTKKIIDNVPRECINSPVDLDQKGGTLVLQFVNHAEVEQRLRNDGILFDSRQYGMRLSPHIYTSEAEIDSLIACLR